MKTKETQNEKTGNFTRLQRKPPFLKKTVQLEEYEAKTRIVCYGFAKYKTQPLPILAVR